MSKCPSQRECLVCEGSPGSRNPRHIGAKPRFPPEKITIMILVSRDNLLTSNDKMPTPAMRPMTRPVYRFFCSCFSFNTSTACWRSGSTSGSCGWGWCSTSGTFSPSAPDCTWSIIVSTGSMVAGSNSRLVETQVAPSLPSTMFLTQNCESLNQWRG